MKKGMTIKELAKLAGVSIATVSKILNHKDEAISERTRSRVLRIAKEFDYTPYSAGGRSDGARSFMLGVLLRSSDSAVLLNGIRQEARQAHYTLLLTESGGSPEEELRGIQMLLSRSVDGILWEPIDEESMPLREILEKEETPYVLMNHGNIPESLHIDFGALGYQAVQSLMEAGHTEIACLLSEGSRTEAFLGGYRRCLLDHGIAFREELVFRGFSEILRYRMTERHVTGIVTSHYAAANRLYQELTALHYHIPRDMSMVSLQNDLRHPAPFPDISRYTIPYAQLGRWSCAELISMMETGAAWPRPFALELNIESRATIAAPFIGKRRGIIVAGSVNKDHYMRMEQFTSSGQINFTTFSASYPGGKGVNQAIGAAKLGAQVTLFGAVGNDIDADVIFSALREYDIDTSGVHRYADTATGHAYIFLNRQGDSMITIVPGANHSFGAEDIRRNRSCFKGCDYCLVQTEIPMEAVTEICSTARRYGVRTILKPSACETLPELLLKDISILVPNRSELEALQKEGELREKADYYIRRGVETVIVTLGAEGCYVRTAETEEYFDAGSFHTVDTTGACDAFISALAVFLQEGYSLARAVRIASYSAGMSTESEGVSGSLPDRRALELWLNRNVPELLRRNEND